MVKCFNKTYPVYPETNNKLCEFCIMYSARPHLQVTADTGKHSGAMTTAINRWFGLLLNANVQTVDL